MSEKTDLLVIELAKFALKLNMPSDVSRALDLLIDDYKSNGEKVPELKDFDPNA